MPVTHKIYYHDTDAGGVVYYANYLKFLEEARTAFFEDLGLGVKAFSDRGLFYAVRYCHIEYKSPARYGDTVGCDARATKVTGAQIIFSQRVWDLVDARTLAVAEVGLVCLTRDFKPKALPDDIRSRLVVI
jgi:tol-pal system-associated acyl-CoA thioesterase